jgi:hypothetical protein
MRCKGVKVGNRDYYIYETKMSFSCPGFKRTEPKKAGLCSSQSPPPSHLNCLLQHHAQA